MCELLTLCSRLPARLTFSLEVLARHGGGSAPHRDGWGVAFYDGRDVQLYREPRAASDSALVRFIEEHGPASVLAISHIRRATAGRPALANTQPFARELAGRIHVFAHNGQLENMNGWLTGTRGRFRRVGETDSELAFCDLLGRLAAVWTDRNAVPPLEDRIGIVREFAADIGQLGTANFLYSDGDAVFAHGHRRSHDDGGIRAPGLCMLSRHCAVARTSFSGGVTIAAPDQDVLLIASVPLSDEAWQPLAEAELVVAARGEIVARLAVRA